MCHVGRTFTACALDISLFLVVMFVMFFAFAMVFYANFRLTMVSLPPCCIDMTLEQHHTRPRAAETAVHGQCHLYSNKISSPHTSRVASS